MIETPQSVTEEALAMSAVDSMWPDGDRIALMSAIELREIIYDNAISIIIKNSPLILVIQRIWNIKAYENYQHSIETHRTRSERFRYVHKTF